MLNKSIPQPATATCEKLQLSRNYRTTLAKIQIRLRMRRTRTNRAETKQAKKDWKTCTTSKSTFYMFSRLDCSPWRSPCSKSSTKRATTMKTFSTCAPMTAATNKIPSKSKNRRTNEARKSVQNVGLVWFKIKKVCSIKMSRMGVLKSLKIWKMICQPWAPTEFHLHFSAQQHKQQRNAITTESSSNSTPIGWITTWTSIHKIRTWFHRKGRKRFKMSYQIFLISTSNRGILRM